MYLHTLLPGTDFSPALSLSPSLFLCVVSCSLYSLLVPLCFRFFASKPQQPILWLCLCLHIRCYHIVYVDKSCNRRHLACFIGKSVFRSSIAIFLSIEKCALFILNLIIDWHWFPFWKLIFFLVLVKLLLNIFFDWHFGRGEMEIFYRTHIIIVNLCMRTSNHC